MQGYTPEWTVSRMKASISESDCLAVPGWSSPLVYPASADCWAMSLVSLTPLLHSSAHTHVLIRYWLLRAVMLGQVGGQRRCTAWSTWVNTTLQYMEQHCEAFHWTRL